MFFYTTGFEFGISYICVTDAEAEDVLLYQALYSVTI
jgi:hypothetical protein